MAISYAVNKAAATMTVMYRATGPVASIYTYNQRRAFLPFDLAATGLSVGQVESAKLIFTVVTVTGGGCTTKITSGIGADGPGAVLQASNGDWASCTVLEDTFVVGGLIDVLATGTYEFQVDPAQMDFAGLTTYRLMNNAEGDGATYNQGFNLNTTTAGSNKPILRLTLTSGQIIIVNMM